MQQKLLILTLVFMFCTGLLGLQAQVAITSSGGNATDNGGKVSYSVGQVFYSSNIGSNGSLNEGVQQTIVITAIDGIDQTVNVNLLLIAYPNPATHILTLYIENFDDRNLSYQLIDLSGKSIETNNITSNKTSISITNLTPAIYFLIIKNKLQEIKTFQIIKK